MKNNTIEIYRRRIAIAALNRMKRKTGGYRLTVSMPDDNIQFIDIDEEAMLQLLQRFEKQARTEFAAEAETFLRQTYMKSVDINGHTEYLTETGKMIVDEIFAEMNSPAASSGVSTPKTQLLDSSPQGAGNSTQRD